MGGLLEKVKIKLKSTQVVDEVEVRVELGKLRCIYWVSFALSFSGPELYFFGCVGGWRK